MMTPFRAFAIAMGILAVIYVLSCLLSALGSAASVASDAGIAGLMFLSFVIVSALVAAAVHLRNQARKALPKDPKE